MFDLGVGLRVARRWTGELNRRRMGDKQRDELEIGPIIGLENRIGDDIGDELGDTQGGRLRVGIWDGLQH